MAQMETMPRPSSTQAFNEMLAAARERDYVSGSNSPRLTLVEYGDFGCPNCFAASRPVKALLDRFDGLRLIWRHFRRALYSKR
jgi:protein-disulfide isomerase